MAQDPTFAEAAGQYANEMTEEVLADAKAAEGGAAEDDLGFDDTLEDEEDDEEEPL